MGDETVGRYKLCVATAAAVATTTAARTMLLACGAILEEQFNLVMMSTEARGSCRLPSTTSLASYITGRSDMSLGHRLLTLFHAGQFATPRKILHS